MDKIILAVFFFGTAIATGIQDWRILIIIPLAILNGYINSSAIKKNKFGDLWHDLQFFILAVIMGVLVWFGIVKLDEVVLIMAFSYVSFEVSLNLFSGWDWNHVGTTSDIDRWITKKFKTLGMRRRIFLVSKLFALFIGFAIYIFNK